jgi:hypothetical protein
MNCSTDRGFSITARGTRQRRSATLLALAIACLGPGIAHADEDGISFWLPGNFASLAATPATPGWSWGDIYVNPHASAGASQAFPRGGQIDLGISGTGNLVVFGPTYTLPQQVLGGQLGLSLLGIAGQNSSSASAILSGPNGTIISGSRTDTVTGFGDLLPMATLKWNSGVNNFMTYATGDIPIGAYDPTRLANLGIGHGAIDGGAGYTYFNPTTGYEFSAVGGLTYNLENTETNYQNGIDAHLDWGASKFINKQLYLGLAGYFFQQVTGDSGSGARLGPFESSTIGIGPQAGYVFPVNNEVQGFLGLRSYVDLETQNRAKGWSVWVTLAFSPAAPKTKTQ